MYELERTLEKLLGDLGTGEVTSDDAIVELIVSMLKMVRLVRDVETRKCS